MKGTRNHPPVAGVDATHHDTMHPGIWLAFGDISGADFWRNEGRIENVRFTELPVALSLSSISFDQANVSKRIDELPDGTTGYLF